MFILDRNITGGAVATEYAADYMGGGLERWYLTTGSTMQWHRMSNGDLVAVTNGIQNTAAKLCNSGSGANGYADVNGAQSIPFGDDNMRRMYTDFTVDGGAYRFKLLRIGATSSYSPGNDFDTYMKATGLSNWNLTLPIVEGIGTGPSSKYYFAMSTTGASQSVAYDTQTAARFYGTPTGAAPIITPEQTALGIITEPKSVTLQLVGSPAVTVAYDDGPAETVQTVSGSATIDMSSKWESLGIGAHTISVRSSQNGYQCGAIITFTKSVDSVSITTKPHLTFARPSIVRVVGETVVPAGAVMSIDVSNNAEDASPQWEPCSDDGTHSFANATKTADQWGLAVRVSIDNSDGSGVAEIRDSLAVGVIYEEKQ